MSSRNVRTVIVNGSIVMRDRVLDLDEKEIFAEARESARRLWGRMGGMG